MTTLPAPQVFISYRREDSAGYARAIHDALAERLGHPLVFMDVDDIGAGEAFDAVIQHAVGGSRVLLVLMGARWKGERSGQPPRIEEPADLVRREIEAGLAKGMHVVPLLIDGTPMPAAASLPPSLRALSGLNALSIGNASFATDIERLLAVVQARLAPARTDAYPAAGQPVPARQGVLRRRLGLGVGLGLGVLGAGGWWWWQTRGAGLASKTASDAARPAINGPWRAVLRYEWQNTDNTEHFEFSGSGQELQGSASFLGVPRALLEGRVENGQLRFSTRTAELGGAALLHRYDGELVGDELLLRLQTEGGTGAPPAALRFRARRIGSP